MKDKIKIAVLSSLAKNTGCWLRAKYLADSLKPYCEVKLIKPLPESLPFMLDMILSIPLNFFKIIFSKADFFIGIKPFPNLTFPMLFMKIFGRRIAIDIDDADFIYRRNFVSELSKLCQTPFPRYFDVVTYHNDLLFNFIIRKFKVKKHNLYKLDQGVDLKTFDSRLNKPKKNVLFYMGHLNVASDLDAIFEAVKIVQSKKDVKFVVAGGGPDEDRFKKLAKSMKMNAKFTGYLSNKEIAKELAKADVCLVYYKESEANKYRCSMKLRECLAMGKKVICNSYGDLKNFSRYTYQSSSKIEDYASKILKVLKSGGDGREKKGGGYVRKNLSWSLVGKRFFEEIVAGF